MKIPVLMPARDFLIGSVRRSCRRWNTRDLPRSARGPSATGRTDQLEGALAIKLLRIAMAGACLLAAAGLSAAAPSASCQVVSVETRVELRSPLFVFHLDTRDGLKATAWENLLTGTKLAWVEASELDVDLGELNAPQHGGPWKVISSPADTPRGPDACEAVFRLASAAPSLSAQVTYRWNALEPVLRKLVRITNTSSQEICLLNVRLGSYHADGKVTDREQGFPVYINDAFFMSVAHPAGWATGQDGQISLRQYPGTKLAPGRSFECMETVYGVGPAGEARKSFVAHVRSRMRRVVRGHDRPYAIFDNFGSWPSGAHGDWRNSEEIEMHSLKLLAESQKASGCHFDICNVHFWVDPAGDLKRFEPQRFPQGITPIKALLDSLGTAPGLWIDSSNTWSGGWGIGLNPDAKSSISDNPGWYCRASEPIKSIYREGFLHHIRNNGVRELKFDNLHTICNNPHHDHLPGLHSTEAIENSVIDFLIDLDKANPDAFFLLYWGYRSPWWLLYGDTLFDSGIGIEAASPSSQPSLYARDSVTQKLDQAERYASDVPALGKDSLGVWLSDWYWNSCIGKNRWQEGLLMDLCRGSLLAQIWADHDWLSPPEWDQLADFLALLRAQPACFGNPRFILGDPWKDEAYGYCCTDGKRAFLALDNCTWQDRAIPLTLDSSWGLPDGAEWDLYRWYPRPARLQGEAEHFRTKAALLLRPFEVVLLEVVPGGQSPSLDRRFASQPLPSRFTEPSRTVDVSARRVQEKPEPGAWTVLQPGSATSRNGTILTRQADDSILASGPNPPAETYSITADTQLTGVTGIRLEMLDDPQLPAHGPGRAVNGNFALTEIALQQRPLHSDALPQEIVLQAPAASYSQKSYGDWPIEAVLDRIATTAWSIDPQEGETHTAIFETQHPVGAGGGSSLMFTLDQQGPREHNIGRFRVSVTTAKPPIPPPRRKDVERWVVRTEAPASSSGGTLVIALRLSQDGKEQSFPDIGSHFSASAQLAGTPINSAPVLAEATYPSSWQAWRILLEPSSSPGPLELLITASISPRVQCAFEGHFVPRGP